MIACVYGLVVGLLVYREMGVRDIPTLLAEAAETTAIPVFILAAASIFGWLLTFHGFGGWWWMRSKVWHFPRRACCLRLS